MRQRRPSLSITPYPVAPAAAGSTPRTRIKSSFVREESGTATSVRRAATHSHIFFAGCVGVRAIVACEAFCSAGILPAVLPAVEFQTVCRRYGNSICGAARTERNVHDGFEIDRLAAFLRWAEFPLRERFRRVGIQLRIDAVNQLDAVHAAILADDGVEYNLSVYVQCAKLGRIFRIHFFQGRWSREIRCIGSR